MLLRGDGETIRKPHPEHQAREIAFAVRDRLETRLPASEDAPPVGWGVVFTGMSRRDLDELKRRGVPFRSEAVVSLDDIEGAEAGKTPLLQTLRRLREAPFRGELEPRTRERMRAVIEPQLHFQDLRDDTLAPGPSAAPPRKPAVDTEEKLPGFWLDRKQERMARELASPQTLIYGPAGSGKTVFLVARAQYWLDQKPDARVLFTCYNASLASHLRRLFSRRNMLADGKRLTVLHYHDLCGTLLGVDDIHERSPEFYASLEPKVLQTLGRDDTTAGFDLILVDEGQDFTRRMVEVLARLVMGGGEITIVCDPAQDIYGRWDIGNLAPLGRHDVEQLVDCYRNTAPIFALALSVLSPEVRAAMGLSRLELTRPEDLDHEGPVPELRELAGLEDLMALTGDVAAGLENEGVPLSQLALLYPDRRAIPGFGELLRAAGWRAARDLRFQSEPPEEEPREPAMGTLHPQSDRDDVPVSDRPHFAQVLEQELCARGMPAEWMARDFASKAAYDITKPRLTLSTVHSAKGMDFHTVILLGSESLTVKPGRDGNRAASLLFTGITRARERLVMPYFADEGWVPEIRSRLGEIEETAAPFPHQPPA
jgi:superfamily I DNA/RNA helicase